MFQCQIKLNTILKPRFIIYNIPICGYSKSWHLKPAYNKMKLLDKQTELESGKDKLLMFPKVKYSLRHYREITKYFSSKECLKEIIPKIPGHFMLRKVNAPRSLILIDAETADNLYSTLKPYLDNYGGHILEINAGLGLLTDLLLRGNHHRLFIYETDSTCLDLLRAKVQDAESGIRVRDFNLLHLWMLTIKDLEDNGTRVKDAFEGLPFKSWEDDPVMRLIIAVPSESFLLQTTYTIIFQNGLYEFGRPELFVTMTPLTYMKMTATPADGGGMYRYRAVLFQIVFEHELLTKVPDKAFMPWLTDSCKTLKTLFNPKNEDKDMFYVVRVTARKNLFHRISPNLIKPLWFFVRMFLQKRKASVIGIMEKWVPGCGVRLISQGYTINCKTGSLPPEQIVDLFIQFVSWPEFKTCSFLPSMEGMMVRMTEPTIVEQMDACRTSERSKSESDDEGEDGESTSDSEDDDEEEEDSDSEKFR